MSHQRVHRVRPRTWIGLADNPHERRLALADMILTPDAQFALDGLGVLGGFVRTGDAKLPLLNIWCKPCGVIIGAIYAVEVHRRLPGHPPYLVLETQHRAEAASSEDQHPVFTYARTLLDTAGEQVVDLLVTTSRAALPDTLETHCRVHGERRFATTHALQQGRTAYRRVLADDLAGHVAKIGRWKL